MRLLPLRSVFLCFALMGLLTNCREKNVEPQNPPVPQQALYAGKTFSGFTVNYAKSVEDHHVTIKALAKIEQDLEVLSTFFTSAQLIVLRSRPIWMELQLTDGAAWYHPSVAWLLQNRYNPEKAKCVEICNMSHYIEWSDQNQPCMVMHELAHLYHDQALPNGHNNAHVKEVFNKVKASGKYGYVDYYDGSNISKKSAYATTNDQEYFAELTEAYFGINDYYPFTYYELKSFDPDGFALMEEVWGVRELPYGVTAPSPALGLNLHFFYRKYLDAGLPIVSSFRVADTALSIAQNIVKQMLKKCPDVLEELKKIKIRVGIIGKTEETCDLPEHRDLYTAFPGTDWNARARGLGPTADRPLVSCGEENLLQLSDDRYAGQNILVHEFAHAIHLGKRRIDPDWDARLQAAFQSAVSLGLWANTRAGSNYEEYFACAVQAYYHVARASIPPDGVYNHVDTNEKLFDYDPWLYTLIEEVLVKTLEN